MAIPRWKKVFADLWNNKARTLLVALSIAVGVFAVGFVASTYLILQNDVPVDFNAAKPHDAVIYTQPFDEELLAAVRHTPGIGVVVGRSRLNAKLESSNGATTPLQITRIADLERMQIDLLRLEQGAAHLHDHEIYLERQVAGKLGYQVGDSARVLLSDGSHRELRIAGTVQDVTGSSFLASSLATAFANANTLAWLGGATQDDQLVLTVREQAGEDHIRKVSRAAADQVEKSGRRVYRTSISHPGQHPSQTMLNALLALLGGLGVLALFLSAFLVVNTINALMGEQVLQIGVMKAIGASLGQVVGLYLGLVLAYSMVALLIAIPAAAAAAYGMAAILTKVVNVNMQPFQVPAA
ncbi:MAG: ABC transporter permease, partial [Chloroflexi bacterium]